MAQLPAMSFPYRFVKPVQEPQPRPGNPGHHCPAVPGLAGPGDQATFFQPVEQASDVRVASNHAFGDLATREPFGRAAKDSQHVVLRRGEILSLDNPHQAPGQHVGSAQQVKEGHLLRTGRAPVTIPRLNPPLHAARILVITNIGKTGSLGVM